MNTLFSQGMLGAGVGFGPGSQMFAKTGWGFLEPVSEERTGGEGFAETGWGTLRLRTSPGMFGAHEGFVGGPVPLRMGQEALPTEVPPVTPPAQPPGGPRRNLPGAPRPLPRAYSPERFRKLLLRLCSIMTRMRDKEVPEEVRSKMFWSYVRHSRQPDDLVVSTFKELCPDIPVPPKPVRPPKELRPERPEQAGFRGKTTLSFAEARELLVLLDEVLRPVTPEEASEEIAERDCLRELNDAGAFPIVEDLRDRLAEFVAAGDAASVFEISQGEIVVTAKAVECAAAIGRARTIRTITTVGGVAAGGSALLLLLGLI